jgi:hypothetical protein
MRTIGIRLARFILGGAVAAAIAVSAPPAFAATYLGTQIRELAPEERIPVAKPQPVQIVFQFQTHGSPNGRATTALKQTVIDAVKASGVFSDVVEGPVPGGAVLSVTINNSDDIEDMQSHQMATGLTAGIVGSTVTDHYTCTVEFASGTPGGPRLSRTTEQRIFTTTGLTASPPPNAEKAASADAALYKMVRQVVGNALNGLAADRAFNPPR